jgi:hypothetical protein
MPRVTRPEKNSKPASKASQLGRLQVPTSIAMAWLPEVGDELRDAVLSVVGYGAAIMVGCTGDGGALAVTVMDGDDRTRKYLSTLDEARQYFRRITDVYGAPPLPPSTQTVARDAQEGRVESPGNRYTGEPDKGRTGATEEAAGRQGSRRENT